MTSPLVEAAAGYLTRGLRVIALNGKTPNGKVHPHWREDFIVGEPESDDDWAFLSSVFDRPDTTGVGILTGFPYVVVDIDTEQGAANWKALVGDAAITDRWAAKTGRGGLHLWYGVMQPTPTFKPFGPDGGVDLKGDGGYVAAPPSLHPDTGNTYEWLIEPGAEAPFEAPEQLARLIRQHLYDLDSTMAAKELRKHAWGKKFEPGDTVFFAQPGHDGLIDGMKTAVEGNRNNYLHWAAATMAEEGAADEFFDTLADVAKEAGLDPVEVRRTIRSARQSVG